MLLKAQTESLIFLNFPRQIYEKSLICDLRLQFPTVLKNSKRLLKEHVLDPTKLSENAFLDIFQQQQMSKIDLHS